MEDTKSLEMKKKLLPIKYDVYQDTNTIVLTMEMPGVLKEDLDIQVDGDQLTVSGKKTLPQIQGEFKLREIRRGEFRHIFTIDNTVDRNKIDAELEKGIVSITLGIKESEKPKKIKVIAR